MFDDEMAARVQRDTQDAGLGRDGLHGSHQSQGKGDIGAGRTALMHLHRHQIGSLHEGGWVDRDGILPELVIAHRPGGQGSIGDDAGRHAQAQHFGFVDVEHRAVVHDGLELERGVGQLGGRQVKMASEIDGRELNRRSDKVVGQAEDGVPGQIQGARCAALSIKQWLPTGPTAVVEAGQSPGRALVRA